MARISMVVFDLAGTTIDDGGGVVLRCLAETTAAFDLPGDDDALNALMGLNKHEVFALLAARRGDAPDSARRVADDALALFLEHMHAAYEAHLSPLPGVEDTFKFLRSRGVKIATDTGFESSVTSLIMERLDWPGRLTDLSVCSSDVPRGRPAPYMVFQAMEKLGVSDVRTVMKVGDSPSDLQEGVNAGCGEVVGVLSGAHDLATLGRLRHTRLLSSVADLPQLTDLWSD